VQEKISAKIKALVPYILLSFLIVGGGIILHRLYFSKEAIANRYYQEGLRDLELDLYEDAYLNFKLATTFFPAHIDARCGRGLSLYKACYLDGAVEELIRARDWCIYLKRWDKLEEVDSLIKWIEEGF
jgi:hypothetical protein